MDALKKVIVGSTNPRKIECVRLAFQAVFPTVEWVVEGVLVDSGVSSQPRNYNESIKGARIRARGAKQLAPDANFWVGLEGGIEKVESSYFDSGWVVVQDRQGNEGIASTIRLLIPTQMVAMVDAGEELGVICDKVFNKENTKQTEGYYGLITKGAINRTQGYRDGVIAALVRFIHQELF